MGREFTRLAANNVILQAHVTADSRYVALPIIEHATAIKGWVVYDSKTGDLMETEDFPDLPSVQNYIRARQRGGH